MKDAFISENFVLQNAPAIELYHGYARDMPIIDFHCHLPPQQIAADHRYASITEAWLTGDHYKWRAMRSAGVPERFITGDASDWEKFQKWAETVPQTLRNPLYHWTHLELKAMFGISDRLLGPDTARGIFDQCNAMLAQKDFTCRGILRRMNVRVVCTTDDPTHSLEHHKAIAADRSLETKVLPTWRPDKATIIGAAGPFNAWVESLAKAADLDIGDDMGRFLEAIRRRHDFFDSMGCRASDHGIESFGADDYTDAEIRAIFRRVRGGGQVDCDEASKFFSAMLYELALLDHEKGWAQQFHYGAMRNNNSRMFKLLGPDTGFDSILDGPVARPMARFFDRLDRDNRLAKTIIYNLNPADNEIVATMLGNFQDGVTPGKMQLGSGWWFLDQKQGMEAQLNALSNMGLLGRFVGMITDSRCFLSYPRHEYFRRILCNLLGTDIAQGLLPNDIKAIGAMVQDICCRNAVGYFGFDVKC